MRILVFVFFIALTHLVSAQDRESIRNYLGKDYGADAVAYSPDDKYVLSASTKLTLWDANTGKQLKTFLGFPNNATGVAFTPDGKKIVASGVDENEVNTIKVWDLNSAKCLLTLNGHKESIYSVAISPDGKKIVSCSSDSTIKVWDLITGKTLKTIKAEIDIFTSVVFSPDAKFVYSGSYDSTIKKWDVTSGQCLNTINTNSEVLSLAISPNGESILAGLGDNTIKLWDINTGKNIKTFIGHETAARFVIFSPDGKSFVSGEGVMGAYMKLWDVNTGDCLKTFGDLESFKPFSSAAYSPNGNYLIAGMGIPGEMFGDNEDENRPANQLNLELYDISTFVGTSAISGVDVDIPPSGLKNNNVFVVIVANENYRRETKVDFALNDGKIFKQYCEKTLGIPSDNIHLTENASLGDIIAERDWLSNNLKAYKGDAKAIFYYAGHGIPGGQNQPAYLLPVDGSSENLLSALMLDDLYSSLTQNPNKGVTVFLDACFSGSTRDAGMLASARGTKLKPRESTLPGNMVVFSAASGDETAWPYKDMQHGMFTYYLLKKLQETKGEVNYKALADYINDNVYKTAIKLNNKPQTPTTKAGTEVIGWENWKLK